MQDRSPPLVKIFLLRTAGPYIGSFTSLPVRAKIDVCPLLSKSGQIGGLRTPEELYKREGAAALTWLRSLRRVRHFMLPAANHAGNRRAEDGRQPEQPELRDICSAGKERRASTARRID